MGIRGFTKAIVNTAILAIIGALFVLKYSARIVDSLNWAYLLAGIFFLLYSTCILFIWRLDWSKFTRFEDRRFMLTIIVILIIGVILFISIYPGSSRVSRLPAINEWISRLIAGQFPWSFSTQYTPSGLPFLFIMAMPFYLIHNAGYLEVIGIILFYFALLMSITDPRGRWLPFIALVLLPLFYYEIIIRSELLFNLTLILVLILIAEQILDPRKLNIQFFGMAVLFGLCLSTRTIVGLVYALYYVYKFRRQIRHGLIFSIATLISFGFTLVPFVIWNPHIFITEGPFSIQFMYLSPILAGLFVIFAVILGWRASNIQEVIFFEGLLLFAIVAVAFLTTVRQVGVNSTVIKDGFDITYFIFCVPFLALSLGKTSVDNKKSSSFTSV